MYPYDEVYFGIRKLCERDSKCKSHIHCCCIDLNVRDPTLRTEPESTDEGERSRHLTGTAPSASTHHTETVEMEVHMTRTVSFQGHEPRRTRRLFDKIFSPYGYLALFATGRGSRMYHEFEKHTVSLPAPRVTELVSCWESAKSRFWDFLFLRPILDFWDQFWDFPRIPHVADQSSLCIDRYWM